MIQVLLLLTVTLRGVSNKHCLLPLFHFVKPICLKTKEYGSVFKVKKTNIHIYRFIIIHINFVVKVLVKK